MCVNVHVLTKVGISKKLFFTGFLLYGLLTSIPSTPKILHIHITRSCSTEAGCYIIHARSRTQADLSIRHTLHDPSLTSMTCSEKKYCVC